MADYVAQYKNVPGWILQAFDVGLDSEKDIIIDLDEILTDSNVVIDPVSYNKETVTAESQSILSDVPVIVINNECEAKVSTIMNKEVLYYCLVL